MRQRGYRSLKTTSAFAFGYVKPDKHAQCGRAMLCRRSPLLPALLKDELAQFNCVQFARVISDTGEQISKRNAVVVQSRVAGSTLLPHPLAECGELNRFQISGKGGKPGWAGTDSTSVYQEHTRTAQRDNGALIAKSLALASAQMVSEAFKSQFIKFKGRYTFSVRPIQEMRCRSDKGTDGNLCVAALL
jgi:hypothetical protein